MTNTEILTAVPLLLILGVATVIDWRVQKIPNVLSFGAAVFALILQATLNGGAGVALAAGGWLLCLVCFLPFYFAAGMAAGDVKLMAAVGAFLGPALGIAACLFTMMAGGVIGLVTMFCLRRKLAASGAHDTNPGMANAVGRTRIPYAGAIAAGTSLVLLVPSVVPSALMQFGV